MTTFPCTTAPALFDSMGGPDDPTVIEAKALCADCPIFLDCRQQGRDGQEWGVWGGESHIERNQALGLSDEERPECGTYGSLMVHRALGEKCEVCLAARRERELVYDAKRRAGKKLVEAKEQKPRGGAREKASCPSHSAYKRHKKKGEDAVACGCRDAYNARRRAERAAQPKKPRAVTACPSFAAYKRHKRLKEDAVACGCNRAYRDHESARRKDRAKAKKLELAA